MAKVKVTVEIMAEVALSKKREAVARVMETEGKARLVVSEGLLFSDFDEQVGIIGWSVTDAVIQDEE